MERQSTRACLALGGLAALLALSACSSSGGDGGSGSGLAGGQTTTGTTGSTGSTGNSGATSSVSVSWSAPTQYDDGSPLTNLDGYKIYYGTSLGDYPNEITVDNTGLTSYVIDNLAPGTYYFVATAVDGQGKESNFSNVGSLTLQ